jgi:hypothetical protein
VVTTTNSIPIGAERVCKTDNVCGRISSETKNLQTLFFFWSLVARQIVAPLPAAAVLSSSNEAFAISIWLTRLPLFEIQNSFKTSLCYLLDKVCRQCTNLDFQNISLNRWRYNGVVS